MRVLMLGWEFPPHISGGLGTACLGLTQGLAYHGVEVLFVVPRAYGDEDASHLDLIGLDGVVEEAAPGGGVRRVARRIVRRARRAGEVPAECEERAGSVAVDAGSGQRLGDPGAEGAPGTGERISILGIPSPLRPYLRAEDYVDGGGHADGGYAHGGHAGGRDAGGRDAGGRDVGGRDAGGRDVGGRAEHAGDDVGGVGGAGEDPAGAPGPRAPARATRAPSGEGGADAWVALAEEVAEAARRSEGPPPPQAVPFGGGYGPGLFDEVARYARAVVDAVGGESFDLIHAHDWMTFPAGVAAAKAFGCPLVIQVHASEYDRSGDHPDGRVRDIEQMGLLQADRVVAVSHYTGSVLRSNYFVEGDKLRVVHNAVTQEESRRGVWLKTIPNPIVLFLGRVTFQKGPDYFLEAARRVVEQRPDVKFVMSGSGDMLPRMIEHTARLGIAQNVHFTGFLRGKDVERMYALADLYVMPSVSEPFGITPLEAMALDVPVIVSRQSGVSEILRNALKVDFWDVEDLANKILAVLERPVLREVLKDEGRAEVRRLRWEASGARLLRVYEELLS